MGGVLIGFAIIIAVIAVGYLVARIDLVGPGADRVLSRLNFFVLSPALLFTTLAKADVTHLFSKLLPISAIAAVTAILVTAVVSLALWRRPVPIAVITGLSAGYVNAGNIGIPVSSYVLKDASSSAPVILLQLVVLAPIALTILDITTSGQTSLRRVLLQPVRNPLIIGAVLGLIVAVTHLQIPAPVLAPFELVAGAAVPLVLLNFGMSLRGSRPLAPGTARRDVAVATAVKTVLMPVIAWVFGRFVFGLDGQQLFAVVALATLPSAQNVFNYAQRYGAGVTLARDIVLITTVLSIPALVIVAALLAPGG